MEAIWGMLLKGHFYSFNFAGDRDVAEFLRIAQRNELNVLLRIGPYVCAEWEFGGLPWWLIKDQADIALRTSNQKSGSLSFYSQQNNNCMCALHGMNQTKHREWKA